MRLPRDQVTELAVNVIAQIGYAEINWATMVIPRQISTAREFINEGIGFRG